MKIRSASRLLLLGGVVAAGVAAIARRNKVDMIDPQTLVIRLPDDLPGRILEIDGVANFRDVGGYLTNSGKRVKTGLIYRSGALADLTETGLELLTKLGIKFVCDLRSQEEADMDPDRLPADSAPIYLHLPLYADSKEERRQRLMALLFNRRKLSGMMVPFYKHTMIDQSATLYGTLLKRLSEPDNLPALLHCTAGKDRTGIGIALLLLMLGVPEDVVVADYSLSNLYYDNFYRHGQKMVRSLGWLGIQADSIQPMLIANPDTLRAALAHLNQQYGSIEAYLLGPAGLDEATLTQLREKLLE